MLTFFGVLTFLTKVKFRSIRKIQTGKTISKYIPIPRFARMRTKLQYKCIRRHMRYINHPVSQGGKSSKQYRWKPIDDFVLAFKEHRARYFMPLENLCVDEFICRWYELGRSWVHEGLPHYVALDRKPGKRSEFFDVCDGNLKVMVKVLIAKGDTDSSAEHNKIQPHGTAVLLSRFEHWFGWDQSALQIDIFICAHCSIPF